METWQQTTEIHSTIQSMYTGVFVIGALLVAGHLLISRNDPDEIRRTLAVLCVSLTFVVAQHDHRIFRLANWVQQVETAERAGQAPDEIRPWETHKAALKSRQVLMPLLDLGMAVAPLYVLYRIGAGLWATQPMFALFTLGGVALGGLMIWLGQKLAGW